MTGKDVILAAIGELGVGGGTNVLEFGGDGAAELSIDERLAVANMAVEAGAETGLFPADETTAGYLEGRVDAPWTAERTDPDAEVLGAFGSTSRRCLRSSRCRTFRATSSRSTRRGGEGSTRSTSGTARTGR